MKIFGSAVDLRGRSALWVGLGLLAGLAVVDLLGGDGVVLAGLMPVAPCLTATLGGRRSVLLVGGSSVALIIALSAANNIWWTSTQYYYVIAAIAISATAYLMAARRYAVEQRLRQVARGRRELLVRLVNSQEAERARIAADVHDDSVQALAAADLRLGLLRRKLAQQAPEYNDLVDQLQVSLMGATKRLRQLMFDLEPPADDVSLMNGLRDIGAYIFEHCPIIWSVQGDPDIDLAYPERVKAIRIAKEALGNARDHAEPHTVNICAAIVAGGVELTITDDGTGIDPIVAQVPAGHRGLATMRDQAEVAGGWFRIEPARPVGSTVRFWIPGAQPETRP